MVNFLVAAVAVLTVLVIVNLLSIMKLRSRARELHGTPSLTTDSNKE